MKKIILMLFLITTSISFSQEFEITPKGIRSVKNNELSYVVLKTKYKDIELLKANAKNYIYKNYEAPKDAIKASTENNFKFSTSTDYAFSYKSSLANREVNLFYETELSFKEGEVKIEFKEIYMKTYDTTPSKAINWTGSFPEYSFFSKKGKLKQKKAKIEFEQYLDTQVKTILEWLDKESEVILEIQRKAFEKEKRLKRASEIAAKQAEEKKKFKTKNIDFIGSYIGEIVKVNYKKLYEPKSAKLFVTENGVTLVSDYSVYKRYAGTHNKLMLDRLKSGEFMLDLDASAYDRNGTMSVIINEIEMYNKETLKKEPITSIAITIREFNKNTVLTIRGKKVSFE